MTMNFFSWDESENKAVESGTGNCKGSFNLTLGNALQGFIPTRDAHVFGTDFKLLCEPGIMPPPLVAILNKLFNMDFPSFAGNGNVTMNYGQNATVNWFGPVINIRRGMVIKKESDDCPLTGPISQAISAVSAMAQGQHVHHAHPPHDHPIHDWMSGAKASAAHAAHGHGLPGDTLDKLGHGDLVGALTPKSLEKSPEQQELEARDLLRRRREGLVPLEKLKAERQREVDRLLDQPPSQELMPEIAKARKRVAEADALIAQQQKAIDHARDDTAAGKAAALEKKAHDLQAKVDTLDAEVRAAETQHSSNLQELKDKLTLAKIEAKQAKDAEHHFAETPVGKAGQARNEAEEKKHAVHEKETALRTADAALTAAEGELVNAQGERARRRANEAIRQARTAKEEAETALRTAQEQAQQAEAKASEAEDKALPEDVRQRQKAKQEREKKVKAADEKARTAKEAADNARKVADERREAALAGADPQEDVDSTLSGDESYQEAKRIADAQEHESNKAAEEANQAHREAAVADAKDKATGWIPPNLTSAAQKAADEAIAYVNTLLGYLTCAVAFTSDVAIKSVFQSNSPNFPDEALLSKNIDQQTPAQMLYDVSSKSLVPSLTQIILDLEQIGLFLDQLIGFAKDLIEFIASCSAAAESWRTYLVRAELAAKLVLDGLFIGQQIVAYKQTIEELVQGVEGYHQQNLGPARFTNIASSNAGG